MVEQLAGMGPAVANHLWQSTVFALLAGLLTLALRKNHARVRYWLWFAASAKFLVPLSLLVVAGTWLRPVAPKPIVDANAETYVVMEEVSQPFELAAMPAMPATPEPTRMERVKELLGGSFVPAGLIAVWLAGALFIVGRWTRRWWRIAAVIRKAPALSEGRVADALRRMERAGGLRRGIRLKMLPISVEPGIFGLWRPVLLWPEAITDRLDDAQLEAIVAHEVCHVRRGDNMTAVLHMAVEAIFWFHPLVWWLEKRLVAEREAACDQDVLALCGQARAYAESILKVCEFCVESPLTCVAGVTGADLKRRVADIVTGRALLRMGWGKKLLLAGAAVCVVAAPVVVGQAKAAQRMMLAVAKVAPKPLQSAARAMMAVEETPSAGEIAEMQSVADPPAHSLTPNEYEVATIKPSKGPGPDKKIGMWAAPDGFSAWFITPQQIISIAYGVKNYQISGGPSWLPSERLDIEAKMDVATADALAKLSRDQRALAQQHMLQALLADRFQLTAHRETTEGTIYTLVIAKGGPKLQEAKPGDTYSKGYTFPDGARAGPGSISGSQVSGDLTAQAVPVARLVQDLTLMLGHPVTDKTGLQGLYDFKLQFTPDDRLQPPAGAPPNSRLPPPPADSNAPSLFDALQEQLGLKLVAGKGPVDVIVIDHIEKAATADGAEVGPANVGSMAVGLASTPPTCASPAAGTIDVASIKPSKAGPGDTDISGEPDGVRASASVFHLIENAYDLRDFQVTGGPDWIRSATWDVTAKVDTPPANFGSLGNAARSGLERQRMQAVLTQRFGLRCHFETRELPVYNLVLAKGGPKLKPTPSDAARKGEIHGDSRHVEFDGVAMSDFVRLLAGDVGHTVVDKTGVTGLYDFTLSWARDSGASAAGSAEPAGPTIFTALEEQLGLKLESGKGPVQVLVVDQVQRPSVDGAEVAQPTLSPGDKGRVPASVVAGSGRAVSAQTLSDTGAVDFNAYIQRIQSDIARNEAPLMPANVMAPSKGGVAAIRLSLLPNGKIGAMKLEQSSGNKDLDKAAWFAITSEGTYPPLPAGFHGSQVELLLRFFNNAAVTAPSARLVPVAMAQEKAAPHFPADEIQKATELQQAGNVDGAVQVYREVIRSAPTREIAAQAQFHLAQALLQKGDLQAAAQEFQTLSQSYPEYRDLVASLTAQMHASSEHQYGVLKDGEFHHFQTGIELKIPQGYAFGGCGPSSGGGEQAYMRSQSKPDVAVWMRPVVEPIDGLRAGVRAKMISKPSERSEGWKERPESVRELTFSGKPGISVVADYLQNGKPWVEYLIWINTGKTHTQFYGRAEAAQLAMLQESVDTVANSAVIP